jgi:hypothetical protein
MVDAILAQTIAEGRVPDLFHWYPGWLEPRGAVPGTLVFERITTTVSFSIRLLVD